jgi:hypothetical protein
MNIKQALNQSVETLFAIFFNTTQNNSGDFEVQSNYRRGTSPYAQHVLFLRILMMTQLKNYRINII